MSYDLQTIKKRINCVDYARSIGLSVSRSGDRCVSPLRNGAKNGTSFVVNEEFFTDFGSGVSGDVIDFAALYEFHGNRGQAIQHLAKRVGLTDDKFDVNEWKKYTDDLNARVERWHKNLTPEYLKYLHDRRVSDKLIERYKIGRTEFGRLSLPYWKNGYCCYYATREMFDTQYRDEDKRAKYMKMKTDDYNQHIVFGLDTVAESDKSLLVVAEGMFDCLAFIDEGYACISAITGNFSREQEKTVFPLMKQFKQVFIVYDNDLISKAGEKFTVKMAKALVARRIPFLVGTVPAGYKDVSEYYADGGDLSKLIETAVPGIEKMCEFLTTREDFEKFARHECRYITKSDVSILFEKAARFHPEFGEKWLKVLEKECTSAPTDDSIAKEIMRKRMLKYHGSFGFYEYNGKYWEPKSDEQMEGYIGKALGVYRTGSRQSSILRVLKAEAFEPALEHLNQAEAVNFCNGTLELQPELKFRDHDSSDMFSYCLDYPYMPDAVSKVWKDYIWSITEDEDKVLMLQEWLGYPLFQDCSMQKALVLLGEGRNGKSPYVNMLPHLYGKTNVSNVSITDLARQFSAMRLMNSLVNTCTETASDANGAENRFKQVTCGEIISDSFKGKDVIDFAPRAKWIMSANKFTTSKTDDSDGYARRFCFCNFNFVFLDECDMNPRNPMHRKANKDIENILFDPKELPGVFNWALEGYYRLKQNKRFTQPADQAETMQEFREANNPLIIFVKEFEFERGQNYISNEDLYKAYVNWADECNHRRLSRNSFLKRVSPLFIQFRSDYIEKSRTGNARGYQSVISDEEKGPFDT